jgi:hypothetical protein
MNEPDKASNWIAVTTNIQYTSSDAPCMASVIDVDLLKLMWTHADRCFLSLLRPGFISKKVGNLGTTVVVSKWTQIFTLSYIYNAPFPPDFSLT